MYRKEYRVLVTLFTLLLVSGLYAWHVYQNQVVENPGIIDDFKFWGKTFVIFAPVMVVAQIVAHILFHIVNKAITNEDIPEITDEMDRLIELKSIRISHWTYSLGFLLAMGALALGMQPWVMFIVLISSGVASGVAESLAQIYFYRKGV